MKRTFTLRWAAAGLFFMLGVAANAQPLLSIRPEVAVTFPTTAGRSYLLQWSPKPSGSWSDLGTNSPGDGTTNSFYDPVANGARNYRVLEMIAGAAPVASIPVNGGFEAGNGITSSNWVVTQAAGGPVYAVRTNTNPNSGSFNFEVRLASTGAGPVVEFNQSSVPVTGGTVYPFTFSANASTDRAALIKFLKSL